MVLKIVVDSSSDIPKDLSSKLDIVTVPMPVYIEGNTYLEGVDIFPDRFYGEFPNYKDLPKTSQPNPSALKETYERILAEGFDVLAIHLSSGLSSTYQSAMMIREMCSSPQRIHILDSLGASFGFGLQAVLGSEVIKTEKDIDLAVKKVTEIRDRMGYIFTLDTLEYLVKGGRVSKTAGFVGGLLDVKPILHITPEGKIEVFGKIRSRKGAIRKLIDIMEQEIINSEEQTIGISHSACLDDAVYMAEEIKKRMKVKEVLISDIGCVVGSHVGPGTLALFYQR
ncbi:MAG: DegV family protein [Peptococcaceae bacterium]|nr:DegV family protein [Peptococcaceae bacterium]